MTRALLEHEARALLEKYEIPVLEYRLCKSAVEAEKKAEKMGFPVVLKVVSPQVVHKSEAGGVALNLQTGEEVKQAYNDIVNSVGEYNPGAEIEGLLLSPFVEEATELIVGGTHDSQFGPVVMTGLGGVFVEIFDDVSFGIAPVDEKEALRMLQSLQAYSILRGARGREPVDIEKVRDLIINVSRFIMEEPVAELDMNPVFCRGSEVCAGDARILLRE